MHVRGSKIVLACTGPLSSLPYDENDTAQIKLVLGCVSDNSWPSNNPRCKTGPGCSKPDLANPGLARILISVLQLFGEVSYLYCLPSVLSCCNLKLHQTLKVNNIFKQENIMPQLLFKPGLTLSGFRTTRRWISTLYLCSYRYCTNRGDSLTLGS